MYIYNNYDTIATTNDNDKNTNKAYKRCAIISTTDI